MKKIYIVFGSTGEYSDSCEWPVRAFLDKAKANELVRNADTAAREIFKKSEAGEIDRWDLTLEEWGKVNPYDSKFQMDYTGTSYFVREVELDETSMG